MDGQADATEMSNTTRTQHSTDEQLDVEKLEVDVIENINKLDENGLRQVAELIKKEEGEAVTTEFAGMSKRALQKWLLRYLNSETLESKEDQGTSLFLHLRDEVSEILGRKLVETLPYPPISGKPEANTKPQTFRFDEKLKFEPFTPNSPPSSPSFEPLETLIKTSVKKELKINGKIGLPGQKDKLSFSSLVYQITQAKKRGYTEIEICDAVIKAIGPGMDLRDYFETIQTLDLRTLSKVLRSHYQEKDATTLFTALSNAKQSADETAQQFVMRLMTLREKIIFVSQEDLIAYPPDLVRKRFLHAVLSGLKNTSVRNQLRPLLTTIEASDTEILENLTKIITEENEHSEKFGRKPLVAATNSIEQVETDNKPKQNKVDSKPNPVVDQIVALRAEIHELSSLKSDVANIMKRMNNAARFPSGTAQNRNNRRPRNNRKKRKCPSCVSEDRDTCSHCFECGSDEHFRAECPKLKND